MGLWIALTLCYPYLRQRIVDFVDAVLLGREDYAVLKSTISNELTECDTIEQVLDLGCARLAAALSATQVEWRAGADAAARARCPGKADAAAARTQEAGADRRGAHVRSTRLRDPHLRIYRADGVCCRTTSSSPRRSPLSPAAASTPSV